MAGFTVPNVHVQLRAVLPIASDFQMCCNGCTIITGGRLEKVNIRYFLSLKRCGPEAAAHSINPEVIEECQVSQSDIVRLYVLLPARVL